MAQKILVAGGGTGGHVYPALAIIEKLRDKGEFKFLYIGGKDGIETRIVPQYNVPLETIWIAGITRSLTFKNLMFPLKLMMSLIKSRNIMRRFKPDVAVGTGGYVSGPVLYAAAKMGVPVLIQEQDVYPGLTTRLLAKYAWRICLAFEGAKKHFRQYLDKTVVTGNPVRSRLTGLSREEALKEWGISSNKLTLFIFGGSQGSRAINRAMTKILPELHKKFPLQVIWQTGEKLLAEVQESLNSEAKDIKIRPYIRNMDAAYSAADMIVCRAGASSLAELSLVAKPAVLVPYPHAAGNHQEHNSRMVEKAGAAFMVKEGEGWEKHLQTALEKLMENSSLRQEQVKNWQKMARPHAAERICEEIVKLIDK